MDCLKCGVETANGQVFCQTCLEDMQQYPVRPDTAIQLPQRNDLHTEKHQVIHREPTAKEQVARLRSVIKWLLAVIALLSVLLCLTGVLLIHTLNTQPVDQNLGRNYTTDIQAGS